MFLYLTSSYLILSYEDAVHALLEWINSVEPAMVSETAIMGDTDTVKLLLDNQKTFMR